MKKIFVMLLAMTLLFACVSCGNTEEGGNTGADTVKSEGVMTYAEYAAAAIDTQVTIEAYIQGAQGWWSDDEGGKITLYLQDAEGGYFAYNLPCTEEEAAKMTKGTKIKISGYKAEYAGEVEVIDSTFEILEGNWVAEATDVTALLGKDELASKMNMFVAFKGMTVEAANESGAAYLYKWDGSGQEGDDLYFNVSLDGQTYTFTVESYLCGSDTDVYKAVKELKVGDKIDMEGFLYWYNGANPHITSVKAAQ